MQGVLLGFGVVLVIVLVGFTAARLLRSQATAMLAGLGPAVYYITNPALMIILVADTDLRAVFGVFTPIALITAALSGGLYTLISRLGLRRGGRQTAVGAMSSSYVNAGNIGLPIALYAVGSSAPVVSVLLAQLLVVAPTYIAVFSWLTGRSRGASPGTGPDGTPRAGTPRAATPLWRTLVGSVANPVTIGTAIGLVLAVTGFRPPEVVWKPLTMIGNASVPMLLLMFGMSLSGQRPFRARELLPDIMLSGGVKLVFMPVVAWAVGHFVFGLGGVALLGVVVMAALPTAQNVYLFSSRFRMPTVLVRDVILLSSLLCLPVILVAALLLR
ncbi:MAG TPA: AEC family transporter [Micrococcaceae bacterium]